MTVRKIGIITATMLPGIVCTCVLWSQTSVTAPPPQVAEQHPVVAGETATSTTAIGAGDLLHVSVLGAPEFERDVRVADAGTVSLPMIGDVHLAGMAVTDAQKNIQQLLVRGRFYADPQVSILVKEFATQGISVLGEVQKPGIYPFFGEHTLFDAVSAAGGTTPKAGRTVTITHRGTPNSPETVPLSYSPGDARNSNVRLSAGDTVVVQKAGMVYVVGDVRQPTGIVLESPGLTVLQAVALAQGANPNAALDKSKVLRKGPNGVQEIAVPLKKMLGAKMADMSLQADDVLFVPNNLAKSAALRTIDTALRTVSGVIIYGSRW